MMTRIFSAIMMTAITAPAGAQDWKVMGSASAFAGQYFFQKSAGAVNGYGDLNLQLARSLSTRSGFFISERSVYTGFKQVNELAGGGTLFQQSLDNSLGFKWMQRFDGGWSVKPRVGVRSQLYRETSDEDWGKGLYDFMRYEGGVALERKTRWGASTPWTYQLAYDLYYTRYTRFKTLSSQFGAELATPDPGSRTLDSISHQFSYRSDWDFPGFTSGWLLASVSLIDYPDQKVVSSQGQYLNSKRSDAMPVLGLGANKRLLDWQPLGRIRPYIGGSVVATGNMSNQNHFDTDPQRLKFVRSYYDYLETKVTPTFGAIFLKTQTRASMGYEFGWRAYSTRPAQTENGSYTTSPLRQYTHSLFLDVSTPIWRNLGLRMRGTWADTKSNTHYEQTYQYNYTSANYFAGVEWKL